MEGITGLLLIMNHGCIIPLDVFSAIMARSSAFTISSLMKTCHALYDEGPRHLLRVRDGFRLIHEKQMDSIVSFMFAGNGTRFASLKKLMVLGHYCALNHLNTTWKHDFIRLLSSPALNLDVLDFYGFLPFSRVDDGVCVALSKLAPVRHLHLRTMNIACTTAILRCIPPGLISLAVVPRGNDGNTPRFLQTIAKHSQTLEELRWNLIGVAQYPVLPEAFDPPSNSPLPQFPRVRKFVAVCNESQPDALNTAALTEAFPNLSILDLAPAPEFSNDFYAFTDFIEPNSEEVRERNQLEQLGSVSAKWGSLTECSGELVHLYSLGLLCHVEQLKVWSTISCDEDMSMLRQVCDDTHPKHLFIRCVGPLRLLQALYAAISDGVACGTLDTLVVGFDGGEDGLSSVRP